MFPTQLASCQMGMSNFTTLDQIPTPPVPTYKTDALNDSEKDLKKLINSINSAKKCDEESDEALDEEIATERQEHEQILIDQLNNLKYEAKLIETLKAANAKVDENEASLKLLWPPASSASTSTVDPATTQSQLNKFNFNFSSLYEHPSMLSLVSSCESSSSGFHSSISSSTSVSPLTVDFLSCQSAYDENISRARATSTNTTASTNQLPRENAVKLPIKTKQLTRCRVVNYLLYPELKEQEKKAQPRLNSETQM